MKASEMLRRVPLFTDLEESDREALAERARIRSFEAGERIISQEEDVRAFFVVLSGRVKIFRSNLEGKEQILYLVDEGQPFCFCTAFTDRPYPVNVDALEPTWVADIPSTAMEDLARRQPMLMLKIVQTLSSRLMEAMNLVEALALQGTRERVAYFLLHAHGASGAPPGAPFPLPVSHKELAKILGTTPETLSRVLQRFVRGGLITASGRNIRILDREGLETPSALRDSD
ncbi:MAG: Crp/Fnr family transcriptional regulator [Desulfovibrionaceae bacterium]